MAENPPTDADVDIIRFIIKCIVRRDRSALRGADYIALEKEDLFWEDVDSYPFTFIDPPHDFISEWDSFYSKTNDGVRFEGPLWSIEQKPTYDVYLVVDKDFGKTHGQYQVLGIRPN